MLMHALADRSQASNSADITKCPAGCRLKHLFLLHEEGLIQPNAEPLKLKAMRGGSCQI